MIDINFYQKSFKIKQLLQKGKITSYEAFHYFESFRQLDPVIFNIETTNNCNMKCIPKNSLVTFADGSNVQIQNVKVGDLLFGYNEKENTIEKTKVLDLKSFGKEPLLKITLNNGYVLKVTDEHKIMTRRGWVESKYLTINDEILVL